MVVAVFECPILLLLQCKLTKEKDLDGYLPLHASFAAITAKWILVSSSFESEEATLDVVS